MKVIKNSKLMADLPVLKCRQDAVFRVYVKCAQFK